MRRKFLLIALGVFVLIFIGGCAKYGDNTIVTPYTDKEIPASDNLLYCSTFQLAWNELQDNMIGAPIKLEDDPMMAQKLNEQEFTKDGLAEEDYIAMVGFGRDDIVAKINEQLKLKFPENEHTFDKDLDPDSILAYAYLFKNLAFAHKFEEIEKPLNFNGHKVQAFGVEKLDDDKVKDQVNVLSYRHADNFVIQLDTKSAKDELILAKVPPKDTLKETIAMVNENIAMGLLSSSNYPKLRSYEHFMVPKLDFDIKTSFPMLERKRIYNEGYDSYVISETYQDVKFKLNEEGAELESEAYIVATGGLSDLSQEPRQFVFDKSFLLLLREKGQQVPYFAMWVNNVEFMEQYKK